MCHLKHPEHWRVCCTLVCYEHLIEAVLHVGVLNVEVKKSLFVSVPEQKWIFLLHCVVCLVEEREKYQGCETVNCLFHKATAKCAF